MKFRLSNSLSNSGFALVLIASALPSLGQSQNATTEHSDKIRTIRNVFLNIHGDDKLGHRLWIYLDFDLEDRGFKIVRHPIKRKSVIPDGCSYQFDDPDWAGHIGVDLAQEAYTIG